MASMLAARSHADSSINERRLRPVYDYLDNGNHKKALQEAEKLLKKQKDFSCAKALKALALVRLSRSDEALSVLKELQAEAPTDDATLQAMTLCYRELERPELVVEAYERATQKEPQNEELLSHLFMGYVRVGRPREQRRTALALHRLRHKNPYYFWAVMSLVLEADQPATSPAERSTLLLLAQRMVDKFVKERRIEAEAEVQLYLMVLEMQEKYQEALDVLHGPLGESLTSYLDFVHQRKVELLSKLGRWPEVNSVCKSLLLEPNMYHCPDLCLPSYLVTPVYLKAGHFQAASANMNLSLKLFTGNYKDTTDYLISCYKYGSFTKIQEMMSFRERLNNSLHFALLTADKMILELLLEAKSQETLKQMLMSMEIDPVNDKTEWSALTDNRDVRIFREWGATRRKLLDEYLERTRQEEVVWLRIRNLLLRLLAACHQLCSQQSLSQPQQQTPSALAGGDYAGNDSERPLANGERAPGAGGTGGPLAVATSLLGSLHEAALEADALPPHPQPYPVLCPQPGRLGAFVSGGCLRALLAAFQWIVDLYKVNEELSAEAPASAEIKVADNLVPLVKSVVSKVKDLKVDSLQSTNVFLEALTNATEVIGWCSLVATAGSSLARPSRQAVAKKGKKKTKEASSTEEALTKCFISLVGELESAATDLQTVVAQATADMLANLMASLNLDHEEPFLQGTEELSKQVRQRIEQSYADSLKELGTMLESKLKLLQSLRA
ncbi:N-alpha-acetyltransferase 25, NatB auxiliary subunit [Dermacentor silvarum]|uniref:N-alpha-acetyltransferase 25, NatB auxiliary subunit n=1 Tax=Dermacentor silvarum TaxID=543639 RepID=UPI002100C2F8|nr:N-alpha-acetyltransferase 25, NatB auxiliary subunit [Dermacentor silvarum]